MAQLVAPDVSWLPVAAPAQGSGSDGDVGSVRNRALSAKPRPTCASRSAAHARPIGHGPGRTLQALTWTAARRRHHGRLRNVVAGRLSRRPASTSSSYGSTTAPATADPAGLLDAAAISAEHAAHAADADRLLDQFVAHAAPVCPGPTSAPDSAVQAGSPATLRRPAQTGVLPFAARPAPRLQTCLDH